MDDENGVKKIRMMMYLLDTYANTFHNILESEKSDIINEYDITDEQLDHILHDIEGYFKEKYRDLEFYNKVYFDLIAGQEEPELDFELSPPSAILEKSRSLAPKISEDMYVLCEKLISGYKIYLEKLEIGIPNKRKICRDIELNHFNNAIVNIRQDYHDYDSYFGGNYDGKSYSEIFSIETKTKLLYNALNFFRREPTKSA